MNPGGPPALLRFVRSVEVAPDEQFTSAAFARVNYVPATDHLVVTLAGRFSQPTPEHWESGHGYKEYTLDMEPTGRSGILNGEVADRCSVMVGNIYYDISMHAQDERIGWRIMEYDAVTWSMLADIFFPVDYPDAREGDPMAAYVNGKLDVSSLYSETGEFPPPGEGASTHHHFFSDDLKLMDERILADTPHVNGSSLIYVDGVYYLITATAFTGDLIVMSYDADWNYVGKKDLIDQAHFSTGAAYDGNRFYVAYTDTSQRDANDFPASMNVHLAVFDRQWNLLQDMAVTDDPASEEHFYTRAWVITHGDRAYVSYDLEGSVGEEVAGFVPGRAFVSVYELLPGAP